MFCLLYVLPSCLLLTSVFNPYTHSIFLTSRESLSDMRYPKARRRTSIGAPTRIDLTSVSIFLTQPSPNINENSNTEMKQTHFNANGA